MSTIESLHAVELLDSRGNPTVETTVRLNSGAVGSFLVPSGASVGAEEAIELRDSDSHRYLGKGVQGVVSNVEQTIAPVLTSLSAVEQELLDQTLIHLDGTERKTRLGANAILSVSGAFARAQANEQGLHLYEYLANWSNNDDVRMPVPMMNVLNGGAHANNNIDIQEFMLVPVGMSDIASAIRCGAEIFQVLKQLLADEGHSTAVGDEGGFAPNLDSDRAALDFLIQAIEQAGYHPGNDVVLALDCAATEFFDSNNYVLKGQGQTLSGEQFVTYLQELVNDYPIKSIEDGLAENDWNSWKLLTERLGKDIQLVGDDIFVTNTNFLQRGIENGVANAILIKLNQIGTLTETLDVMRLAWSVGYNTIISHRSGDTEDNFIADLAVGTGAGQIKTGSLCRSERISKYNQLMRMEAQEGHMKYCGLQEILIHRERDHQCGYSSA
ncbi:MAG: phosphopyruvate hydratase [Gammaproteobacteria bacterium]|nr:phosphopyruvate hydratase [Gammaproteobacteria bacterium]MYI77380.1 phosphopyruvate hydratase [Gammaproteobacteria bacterium]